MSDPRNPKRLDGPEGDNWARCRRCGRGAEKARLIRHSKACCAIDQAIDHAVPR
jgi:hypothetical protein